MTSWRDLLRSIACNVLALACDRGWPWIASTAMEALSSGFGNPGEAVQELQKRMPGAPSLLHRAVCSEQAAMVHWLLSWGDSVGHRWDVNDVSFKGLSVKALADALHNEVITKEISEYDSSRPGTQALSKNSPVSDGASNFQRSDSMGNMSKGNSSDRGMRRSFSSNRGIAKGPHRRFVNRSTSWRMHRADGEASLGSPQNQFGRAGSGNLSSGIEQVLATFHQWSAEIDTAVSKQQETAMQPDGGWSSPAPGNLHSQPCHQGSAHYPGQGPPLPELDDQLLLAMDDKPNLTERRQTWDYMHHQADLNSFLSLEGDS
uniref:Uncharacterized protein n=1 Tax=Tetraselmis sp. GSL018 TaxID=582737 RepID=A0A061R182_9CHLO